MSDEHIANATTPVFAELALYVMAVAEKYGHEEAFDLLATTFGEYGAQVGSTLRERLEGRQANAEDIYGMMAPMEESVGFDLELLESSPSKVTMKVSRCPLYEGCQAVGAPDEEFCQNLGLRFVNGIAKTLNPAAVWRDVKHRASPADFCLEEIVIG